MGSQTYPLGGNIQEPMKVWYTAKNINATNGSRSAISTGPTKGAVLVLDPYQWDGPDADSASAKPLNFTQPQISFLHYPKVVVASEVDSSVRTSGGYVSVLPYFIADYALVDGTTDVTIGDELEVTNGSFNLTKRAALTADLVADASLTIADSNASPDYTWQALTTSSDYGLATQAEAISMLYVIKNNNARTIELKNRITSGICARALETYTTDAAALKRVSFNGLRINL